MSEEHINITKLNSCSNAEQVIDYLCPFNLTLIQLIDTLIEAKSLIACYVLFKIFSDTATSSTLGLDNTTLSKQERKRLSGICKMEHGQQVYPIIQIAASDKNNHSLRFNGKSIGYSEIDQRTFYDIISERVAKSRMSVAPSRHKAKTVEDDTIADKYDYGLSDW